MPAPLEHTGLPVCVGWIRVARSLVFSLLFCRQLFPFVPFFFWLRHYLSYKLRILITSLVSYVGG